MKNTIKFTPALDSKNFSIVPIDYWNNNHKLKAGYFAILDWNHIPNGGGRIFLHDELDYESSFKKLIYLGFQQNIEFDQYVKSLKNNKERKR